MNRNYPSPFAGLHKLARAGRQDRLCRSAGLSEDDLLVLAKGLSDDQAEKMIENVVGLYALPMGIAANFLINDTDVAVPMVIEEPSVIAAASYGAKLARAGGGFHTSSSESIMIGQIQVLGLTDIEDAIAKIQMAEHDLLAAANQHHPTIQKLGGGAKRIECRSLPDTAAGPMLIVHILYDCRDAMGANAVNTAAEALGPLIEQITGARVNLKILSNLNDLRTARAECLIPIDQLAKHGISGEQVAQSILAAHAFATADPYRATTHNKGIMNGIDAVALATGNDWRALEAAAHAYASRNGRYSSLSQWSLAATNRGSTSLCMHVNTVHHLRGVLDMPLSVGVVGGTTRAHPTARISLKILGQPSARGLAEILVAVGLAQNLASLRALTTEGVQHGHMRLHARKSH